MRDKNIRLRPFVASDGEAMIAVLLDTFASTWEPELIPSARAAIDPQKMMTDYVNESGVEFVVGEHGDQLAGMVHWRDDFVYALHVHSSAQGNGLGKALLGHAEAEIGSAGHAQVRLETDSFNLNSQRFYKKRGYAETGRCPDKDWNSGFITVCFEKAL